MSKWAETPKDRHQPDLIAPSLDEQIGEDHGIRVFDELLKMLDWSDWEGEYILNKAGRPPIHPRLVAGAILYGLLKKIRTTRDLEDATMMRLDFQWFLGGLVIDHTTFCIFRQRFEKQIESIFKQLNSKASELRKATIDEILIDGTRTRADSDRHGARTATALERKRTALEKEIFEALKQLSEKDEPISQESREELEKKLKKVEAEKRKIEKALETAHRRDVKKRRKDGKNAKEVRVPVTDPESIIIPNKDGGYAPNYTPVIAVEQESGLIVGTCIAEEGNEGDTVEELVEQATQVNEKKPKRVLCDSGFNSGSNIEMLENEGIEIYTPVGPDHNNNPAVRADTHIAVTEDKYNKLPMKGKMISRDAFIYDSANDCYRCPQGREMPFHRTHSRKTSQGDAIIIRKYRSCDCSNCPLASKCIKAKSKVRTVSRDQYEDMREKIGIRMSTEEAKKVYSHRAPGVEGAFAQIKRNLDFRRFMRRGRTKVQTDWLWVCTAHNLMKIIKSGIAETAYFKETSLGKRYMPCFCLSMYLYEDRGIKLAA